LARINVQITAKKNEKGWRETEKKITETGEPRNLRGGIKLPDLNRKVDDLQRDKATFSQLAFVEVHESTTRDEITQ